MTDLIIDPEFRDLLPPLPDDKRKQLEENILQNGIREPLVLWQGILIDGHNRYEIAKHHNLPFTTVDYQFDDRSDVRLWIAKNQFGRRDFSAYERSVIALQLKPDIAKKAKEKQIEAGGAVRQKSDKAVVDTKKEVAKLAGVSHDTIAKVEKIEKQATPEVKAAVKSGEISINAAYKKIKVDERKQEIQKQASDIEQKNIAEPNGLFNVIVIDPAWNYGTHFSHANYRGNTQYPEMSQDQLKAIELPADDNCVLFLWTTHKFIWDAKELLDHWGFDYRCLLVWDKQSMGMGGLIRMQCEFCLIGIKGKPTFKDVHNIRDLITEQKREHSRKPEAFYQLVEELCYGRKLDYFSRAQREGWASYGNDTNKFSNNRARVG